MRECKKKEHVQLAVKIVGCIYNNYKKKERMGGFV